MDSGRHCEASRHLHAESSTSSSHDPTDYDVIDDIRETAWHRDSGSVSLHDAQSLRRYCSSNVSEYETGKESTGQAIDKKTVSTTSTITSSLDFERTKKKTLKMMFPPNVAIMAQMVSSESSLSSPHQHWPQQIIAAQDARPAATSDEAQKSNSWQRSIKHNLRFSASRPSRLDLSTLTLLPPSSPAASSRRISCRRGITTKDISSPKMPSMPRTPSSFLNAPLPLTPPQQATSRGSLQRGQEMTATHKQISPFASNDFTQQSCEVSSLRVKRQPASSCRRLDNSASLRSPRESFRRRGKLERAYTFPDQEPLLPKLPTRALPPTPPTAHYEPILKTHAWGAEVSQFDSDSEAESEPQGLHSMQRLQTPTTMRTLARRWRKSSKSLFTPRSTNLALS